MLLRGSPHAGEATLDDALRLARQGQAGNDDTASRELVERNEIARERRAAASER